MTIKNLSLSHIINGHPTMIDVQDKPDSHRFACAEAYVHIPASLGVLLRDETWISAKGPVFHTAVIAGTMAVKNTSALIPLCHPLSVSGIKFQINLISEVCIKILCNVTICAKTGVEMEALTGVSIAALTIYDMCKSYSSELWIGDMRLIKKTGGRHDYSWTNPRGRQEFENERAKGSS